MSAIASQILAQPIVKAQIKENFKAPRQWPLWEESTDDWWIAIILNDVSTECLISFFFGAVRQWPVDSPHKGPVTQQIIPLMMSSGTTGNGTLYMGCTVLLLLWMGWLQNNCHTFNFILITIIVIPFLLHIVIVIVIFILQSLSLSSYMTRRIYGKGFRPGKRHFSIPLWFWLICQTVACDNDFPRLREVARHGVMFVFN